MSAPRPFRFSVQATQAESAAEWTAIARRAEDLGYSTLFTADHYYGPGDIAAASGTSPIELAPVPAIMAAADVTSTLRVGCRVFCVDYHHPVVLAKELATVDLLSGGRLEVGLGAGWVAAEYAGLGIAMDRAGVRIERLTEVVDLMRQHWSGEPLQIVGEHVHAVGFAGRPLPAQRPGPPIMIGGGSPRVLRLAGRLADIVSINFNNASGALGASAVASSTMAATEQKLGWVRAGAGERYDSLELELGAYFVAIAADPRAELDAMADRFGVSATELREHPHALIGSVDEVCDRLVERRARLGFSNINVAQRRMEQFAPVVARLTGT